VYDHIRLTTALLNTLLLLLVLLLLLLSLLMLLSLQAIGVICHRLPDYASQGVAQLIDFLDLDAAHVRAEAVLAIQSLLLRQRRLGSSSAFANTSDTDISSQSSTSSDDGTTSSSTNGWLDQVLPCLKR
jgi:hypothetical protein